MDTIIDFGLCCKTYKRKLRTKKRKCKITTIKICPRTEWDNIKNVKELLNYTFPIQLPTRGYGIVMVRV